MDTEKNVDTGKVKLDKRKVIGKGNDGGVVYEGLYGNLPVAVKRICQTYLNESDLLNPSVNHENLLHYYGKEEDDDFFYFAMELCPASLEHLINGSYHEPSLLGGKYEIARQVALGLQYLHSRDIVHGDLKPQNIMITHSNGKPAIKLCDFGIHKEPGRRLSESIDAMSWRAPEFYDGEIPIPTKAGDIFSLGCVLGYLWTGGCHPFGESTSRAGNIKRNELHWRQSTGIPEGLKCLIKRMLDHDPNNRPKINEIVEDLELNENQYVPIDTHQVDEYHGKESLPASSYTLENGVLNIYNRRKVRVYNREFVLKLRNSSASRKWPKTLKELRCVRLADISVGSLSALCSAILNAVTKDAQRSSYLAETCKELWSEKVPLLKNRTEKTSFCEVFLDGFQERFWRECANVGGNVEREIREDAENRHCTAKNPLNQAELFGLVRLLEELYKLKLVPGAFMRSCIMHLLSQAGVETSLKCACCVLLSDVDRSNIKSDEASGPCGGNASPVSSGNWCFAST